MTQYTPKYRLANCLGLDSSKYQIRSGEPSSVDAASSHLLFAVDDEERFRDCKLLTFFSCPSCFSSFDSPSICSAVSKSISENSTSTEGGEEASNSFWSRLSCPKCPTEGEVGRLSPDIVANQVKRQADEFICKYYKSFMMCDDETCKHTTRSLNLRVLGDAERGTVCPEYPRCNGRLVRKYTEADLYKQLSYFCHIDKVDLKIKPQVERELARLRPMVEIAASIIQKIRNRCAYGWVQMKDVSIF